MHRIKEVIVVEGRYDKNALSQVVDAAILETSGFGIFRDTEKQKLFRTLAESRGLIVLTDPDGAGFVIRGGTPDDPTSGTMQPCECRIRLTEAQGKKIRTLNANLGGYEHMTFDSFIVAKTPAARWLKPEELAGPAVFLASHASDAVNGHILYVDGGILAYIGKQP